MKKQISMLLATACAASLLAACGGSGSTAASASAARFHRCIVRGDGCRRRFPLRERAEARQARLVGP